MVDEATKKTLCAIPLLKTKAGPRDKDLWVTRLKEEYQALIKYVENNKVKNITSGYSSFIQSLMLINR